MQDIGTIEIHTANNAFAIDAMRNRLTETFIRKPFEFIRLYIRNAVSILTRI